MLKNRKHNDCKILVGTSGYSYNEWIEAGFYPQGTKTANMLSLYAEHFPVTELNYTWYQMPRADAIERQRQLAPPDFLFAAKLTRTLTHDIDPEHWESQVTSYCEGIFPLKLNRQLLCLLIQFPTSFDRTRKNREYLAKLLDSLNDLPLAVEFRHRSWANDRVFAELERRHVTLVNVDIPEISYLFPSLDVVTNPDLFYVRFHGRNAKGWRSGNMNQQFDYNYTEDELIQWVETRIIPMSHGTKNGILFFNNHFRGQAPKNAEKMAEVMKQQRLSVNVRKYIS